MCSVRSDRGAIPIIAVILAGIFATAAAVTSVVILKNNQSNNSGSFSLTVNGASAVRDSDDQPTVTVQYVVDLQSDGGAAALQSVLSVRCTIAQQQLTQRRSFTGDGNVVVNTRFAPGSVVVVPADANSIQGDYSVSCRLLRDGVDIATAGGPSVTIPPPNGDSSSSSSEPSSSEPSSSQNSPPPNPGGQPVTDFAGRYPAIFDRADGDINSCPPTDQRTVVVTATTETTVKVELDGLSVYQGLLDGNLVFTSQAALYPGHADYYGVLKGQFFRVPQIGLAMSLTTTNPPCDFSFSANRA